MQNHSQEQNTEYKALHVKFKRHKPTILLRTALYVLIAVRIIYHQQNELAGRLNDHAATHWNSYSVDLFLKDSWLMAQYMSTVQVGVFIFFWRRECVFTLQHIENINISVHIHVPYRSHHEPMCCKKAKESLAFVNKLLTCLMYMYFHYFIMKIVLKTLLPAHLLSTIAAYTISNQEICR